MRLVGTPGVGCPVPLAGCGRGLSSSQGEAVVVEDGVQGSSVASRNKLKVSCHSSRRVVVNAMVSRRSVPLIYPGILLASYPVTAC